MFGMSMAGVIVASETAAAGKRFIFCSLHETEIVTFAPSWSNKNVCFRQCV